MGLIGFFKGMGRKKKCIDESQDTDAVGRNVRLTDAEITTIVIALDIVVKVIDNHRNIHGEISADPNLEKWYRETGDLGYRLLNDYLK